MSGAIPDVAIAMPPTTAAPRAIRTRLLSLKVSSHAQHRSPTWVLTRRSSAAATGSAAENLLNCFSHRKRERAAGSRRLQRFVRPLVVSNVRGTSLRHFLLQYRPSEQ